MMCVCVLSAFIYIGHIPYRSICSYIYIYISTVRCICVAVMLQVGVKLKHVMIPRDTVAELRDWDLWGPLLLCLVLATTLSISARDVRTFNTFHLYLFTLNLRDLLLLGL